MKAHIKQAWLDRLTPEWWETRAKGRLRDANGCMCVAGVLCDVIDPTRWGPHGYHFPNGSVNAARLPFDVENAIGAPTIYMAMACNDTPNSAYADCLAAVQSIPVTP